MSELDAATPPTKAPCPASSPTLSGSTHAPGYEPIAIVGMACRFPGANNLSEFWNLLISGDYAVGEVPPGRWDINNFYDPDPSVPGKVVSRHGGFLNDLEKFDAFFFGISPREAPHVDPRQRVMLEVAWEALEDAGIPPRSLAGSKTGVFVSTLTNDYDQILNAEPALLEVHSGPGTADSIIPNRISYVFDFRGPSISIDTACSGSLIAIDMACKSIHNDEATLALAGGVAVNLLPTGDIFFSKAGSLSPDGKCRTFDAGANGIVRSEGAALIVLKRLSEALAHGDRIYAVVRGCGVNHDGRTNGITAPNPEAQQACLRDAYRRAGISPGKVQYVEAHGTGTVLGDPVEVSSIAAVLGAEREPGFPCVIGSVKTNIGHTESAAGVAGVIKTALAIKNRLIPPNLHLENLNPKFPATKFPIKVCQTASPWPAPSEPLIAGVSSFGFGGANSHVVLQEFVQADVRKPKTISQTRLLPLSARTPEALSALASAYVDIIQESRIEVDAALDDICYSASIRRSHHEYRLALPVQSKEDIRAALEAYVNGGELPAGVSFTSQAPDDEPRLVFVFSGQGVHRANMGRELWDSEPVFRKTVEDCDALIQQYMDWSVVEQITNQDSTEVERVEIIQLTTFVFQVALADLWRSWGIHPSAIVGQSLGEVAAAYAAGALTLADAVRVVYHRSRLLNTTVGKGRTAVAGAPIQRVEEFLQNIGGAIAVAGNTGPLSCVVSGDNASIDELGKILASENIFFRPFVPAAAHSPQMDPLVPELLKSIEGITPRRSTVPFISTVTAAAVEGEHLGPEYWGRNLREPFRLWDVLNLLIEDGYDAFLEVSCHPAVTGSIRQGLAQLNKPGIALPSLEKDKGERFSLLSSLGALYCRGYQVDWKLHYPNGGQIATLPTYPWQRERYWIEDLRRGKSTSQGKKSSQHPLLGEQFKPAHAPGEHFWEVDLSVNSIHYLKGHSIANVVVFPGAGYVEMALAAAQVIRPQVPVSLEDISFERPLVLSKENLRRVQMTVLPAGTDETRFQIFSSDSARPGEAEPWTLHASGTIRWDQQNRTQAPGQISVDEVKARCPELVSGEVHYSQMEARQIQYGPAFQALSTIWRRDGEALAQLDLPLSLTSEARAYRIHPALLDAAFQTVAGTLPAAEGDSYVPRSIKALRLFSQPETQLLCDATLQPGSEVGAETLNANLSLVGSTGAIVATIDGLVLQRLDKRGQKERRPEDLIYEVCWRPMPQAVARIRPGAGASNGKAETKRTWVIFADAGGVADALAAQIEDAGYPCVLVHHSDRYQVSDDAQKFWINADEPADTIRLFTDLSESSRDCRGVIHCWGLDTSRDGDALDEKTMISDLSQDQRLCAMACANIIPALVATAGSTFPHIWLVTKASRSIDGEPVSDRLSQATLWGLGRVIAREHPEFWGGSIDLDLNDSFSQIEMLCQDILEPDGEDQIAYRGSERYVARLSGFQRVGAAVHSIQCQANGGYLVTGGLTGIGIETAYWLADKGARRLILLSRTALPPRSTWRGLDESNPAFGRVRAVLDLEARGLSVHIGAVDVASPEQLKTFLEDYRSQGFPPIRGVVHSAGLIRDQLLLRMDAAAFQAVFKSKLYGTWLLHHLTRDMDLDFFVMYSSLSSLFGQFGQANYASGNAFIDALVQFRRSRGLPGVAINWGPWSRVGIFAGMKGFESEMMPGVRTISPEDGRAVLDLLVRPGAPAQAAVMDADWSHVPANVFISEMITSGAASAPAGNSQEAGVSILALLMADPTERAVMIEDMFREEVARVLRTEPSRVSATRPLTTLGMDSIMAVELKNRIEASLNMPLPLTDLFTGSISRLAERMAEQIASNEQIEQLLTEIERMPAQETAPQSETAQGGSSAARGIGGSD